MKYTSYRLDAIETILGETEAAVRAAIRSGFLANRLKIPADARSISQLLEIMSLRAIDIIICDIDLPGGDFCQMCRDIRNQKTDIDPFIPIIAYGNLDARRIAEISQAGVDHILQKPISVQNLVDRIFDIIEKRKGFIVADDYIGPARRTVDTAIANKLEVPNIIKAKVTNDTEALASAERLREKAMHDMNLRCIRIQASALVRDADLVAKCQKANRMNVALQGVANLKRDTLHICHRLAGKHNQHVRNLCQNLLFILSRISDSEGRNDKEISILHPLTLAITAALGDDPKVAEAAREIVDLTRRSLKIDFAIKSTE